MHQAMLNRLLLVVARDVCYSQLFYTVACFLLLAGYWLGCNSVSSVSVDICFVACLLLIIALVVVLFCCWLVSDSLE